MKILTLYFKNLNSLLGEWTIDFTAPEYSEQGIFVITGPTGAGKSTILDAICLALYGRTPRLDKINATQNEIMSRHTGECFAGLEFKTSTGHYRALWSQMRARKKADGNLQTVQHVIEDYEHKKTLENKLSKIPELVTDLTGMDFEHFTRAMLLAQGGFAKFLQSNSDERSPILEKITGTEIYTKISKQVHARKTNEESKLAIIQEKLSGINLLSSEEVILLEHDLNDLESKIRQLMTNKSELDKQQSWLSNLAKLRDELTVIKETQQQIKQEKLNFVNDELRLKNAKLAIDIDNEVYISLTNLRQHTGELNNSLFVHQQELPLIRAKLDEQQIITQTSTIALANYKISYEDTRKILQQVRLLDADIASKTTLFNDLNNKLHNNENQVSNLREENVKLAENQQNLESQIEQVVYYLTENQVDAGLVTSYSGICADLDNQQKLALRLQDYQQKLNLEQNNQQDLAKQLQTVEVTEVEQQSIGNKLLAEIKQLKDDIQELANGQNIAALKDELINLNIKQTDYHELNKNISEQNDIKQRLDVLQKTIHQHQEWLINNQNNLAQESKLLDTANQNIEILTEQKSLQSKIISLNDERDKLQNNNPCPLCGALEHPFATHLSINDQLDIQLNEHKKLAKDLQSKVSELNKTIASLDTKVTQFTEQQQELIDKQCKLQVVIDNQLTKHDLGNDINNEVITTLLDAIDSQIISIQQQIQQLHDYEQKLKFKEDHHHKINAELINLAMNIGALNTELKSNQKSLAELNQQINSVNEEHTKRSQILSNQLSDYRITLNNHDDVGSIKETLEQRIDKWQSAQENASRLKDELRDVKSQIQQNCNLEAKLNETITEQQDEIAGLEHKFDELTINRFELFADKNVETVEQNLQQELKNLEEQNNNAVKQLNQLKQEHSTKLSLIESQEKELRRLQDDLQTKQQKFNTCLQKVEFVDENDFLTKHLSREDINKLQGLQDDLQHRTIELDTRYNQTNEQLEREDVKQLTNFTNDELVVQISNIQTDYDKYNQRIGEIRGQLTANNQAQQQSKDVLKLHENQQLITERFRRLHSLIGSSDGKKFRNFAQGLTFDLVVKHANQQLLQMSDRYLLIRDNNAPLELNVIDNYQGGEIRSTKNLSGGESFVISLALALGLSKLSSNKVQVDSLFLDEGFGTLDEDSLQTALDALDSLQRDGKLIGVISHVGALKERISLQIQVEPMSGGVSRISGVGCSGK